jgi:hypothetical protein
MQGLMLQGLHLPELGLKGLGLELEVRELGLSLGLWRLRLQEVWLERKMLLELGH